MGQGRSRLKVSDSRSANNSRVTMANKPNRPMVPIDTLPSEVLLDILALCLPSEPCVERNIALYDFCQVAWSWRNLVLASPTMWSFIFLEINVSAIQFIASFDRKGWEALKSKIRARFDMARGLPIHFAATFFEERPSDGYTDRVRAFIADIFATYSRRMKFLKVKGPRIGEIGDIINATSSWIQLEVLELWEDTIKFPLHLNPSTLSDPHLLFPRLHRLSIVGPTSMATHIQRLHVPWTHLSHLTFHFISSPDLLGVLRECSDTLQYGHFVIEEDTFNHYESSHDGNDLPARMIIMTKLIDLSLILSFGHDLRGLLEDIEIPVLSRFDLMIGDSKRRVDELEIDERSACTIPSESWSKLRHVNDLGIIVTGMVVIWDTSDLIRLFENTLLVERLQLECRHIDWRCTIDMLAAYHPHSYIDEGPSGFDLDVFGGQEWLYGVLLPRLEVLSIYFPPSDFDDQCSEVDGAQETIENFLDSRAAGQINGPRYEDDDGDVYEDRQDGCAHMHPQPVCRGLQHFVFYTGVGGGMPPYLAVESEKLMKSRGYPVTLDVSRMDKVRRFLTFCDPESYYYLHSVDW